MMEDGDDPVDLLQFGIGSYCFSVESDQIGRWGELVESTLRALPSVSDIEVDFTPPFASREDSTTGGVFPARAFLAFSVHIPKRLQTNPWDSREYNVENFTVMSFYELSRPVTFIISEGDAPGESGSTAMFVVREFLRKELATRPGPAQFNVLGPTPFHADLSLEPADQVERFELSLEPRPGYGRFRFTYSKESFESPRTAAANLFFLIKDELNLYYGLVDRRNSRLNENQEVANMTESIIEQYQAGGLKSRVWRFFTVGSKLRKLAMSSILARYRQQEDVSDCREDITAHYSYNKFPCFKDYVEREVSEDYSSDWSIARELAALLDEARSRQIELTGVIVSALAGGLAGALVSVLIH
jgi:hypothetical protein